MRFDSSLPASTNNAGVLNTGFGLSAGGDEVYLYDKLSRVLGLTRDELARLAALEHHEALDQKWLDAPAPRFGPMRELVLRKCRHARQRQMRDIFEKQPFGELEQLITPSRTG